MNDLEISVSLSKASLRLFGKLADLGDFFSAGVHHVGGGEIEAWINFKPPYEKKGGSWCRFENDADKAVRLLYKDIMAWHEKQKPATQATGQPK